MRALQIRRFGWVVLAATVGALGLTGSGGAARRAEGNPAGPAIVPAAAYTLMGDATNNGSDQTRFFTSFDNGFCAWCFTSTAAAPVAVKAYTDDQGVALIGQTGNNPGPPYSSPAGLLGSASASTGVGVYGVHLNSTGTAPGVKGETFSSVNGAAGVFGHSNTGTQSYGVLGTSPNGYGLFGYSNTGLAFVGSTGSGYAGYFVGPVHVEGTLTKSAGSFLIDDPTDPANKTLQHSFVESPDMKNVYDGVVTTDANGFATVQLPHYFQALNRDFRYQLTIVGHSFAQAIVWKEIADNRFTIRTNQPKVNVSWQVTGIRHDAYAEAHRIPVEQWKSASQRGRYLNPAVFGKPSSAAMVKVPTPPYQTTK